jgi:hypothetical protein
LPCEYAEYKNLVWCLVQATRSIDREFFRRQVREQGLAMSDDDSVPPVPSRKALTPAAQRALAEAEARRKAALAAEPMPREVQGPKGPEPTRYGDWERKGIASDF